jgi:hypothetical protein
MAIILFNPTNEDLKDQYIGEDVLIPAGGKIRVDDARGRHMLNVMGPRGLVTLEYGDEGEGEKKKAAAGRERNLAFKRKHVMNFNALNDKRIQTKQPFLDPDAQTRAYARELGMKLYEPYGTSDDANMVHKELKEKLDAKDRELLEANTALSTMQAQIAALTKMVGQVLGTKAAAGDADANAYFEEFAKKSRNVNGKYFQKYVADNWETIQSAPKSFQDEMADKYARIYDQPFPTSQMEARAACTQNAA